MRLSPPYRDLARPPAAIVPLSAVRRWLCSCRRLPSSQATTCGFIGLSRRVPRSSMSAHHSAIAFCAVSRTSGPPCARASAAVPRACAGCHRPAPPPPDTAARPAWGRARSGRRAPARASAGTRCRGNEVPTIRSVSHSSRASWEGLVPSRPMDPVVYGQSSGTAAFPSRALTMGAPSRSAICSAQRSPSAPWPARIATRCPH